MTLEFGFPGLLDDQVIGDLRGNRIALKPASFRNEKCNSLLLTILSTTLHKQLVRAVGRYDVVNLGSPPLFCMGMKCAK